MGEVYNLFDRLERRIKASALPSVEDFISPEEMEDLIVSFAESRDDRSFTEQEAEDLIHWVFMQRLGEHMMHLVIRGDALIDWNGVEPTFKISEQGKEKYNALTFERENNATN